MKSFQKLNGDLSHYRESNLFFFYELKAGQETFVLPPV